jgi:hypothetical protein
MVSEHENAKDHGRLPAHEVREIVETSLCLLQNKQREGRRRFDAFNLVFFCFSSVIIAADCYMKFISSHMLSYDKVSCPYITYDLPKVVTPTQQFMKYSFYLMTGFWTEQVSAISVALTLMPYMIQC